jgi:UDP-GlcNAc:undecaprenyl-phosphate GlcNAc-1-phosphate transferase
VDHWRAAALAGTAFVLAMLLVPLARRVAVRLGITDHPARGKWHRAPTPYLGGTALVVAALSAAAGSVGWERDALLLVGAALVVSFVGLVDDVGTASLALRVGVEVTAAVAAFVGGSRVDIGPEPVDLLITVAWIVVVTNGCNLLDNMDGALGAIGAVIAGAIGVAALLSGQFLVGGLALATAGACLGFLVHNWHPATIFMGDAGSLFLGFLLAALSLRVDTAVEPFAGAVAAALLVAPALFDTSLVVISRLLAGRSILVGGTDHTAHRLRRAGLGPRASVGVLAGGAILWAGTGIGVARDAVPALVGLVALTVPAAPALVLLLRRPSYEVDEADEADEAPARVEHGARKLT